MSAVSTAKCCDCGSECRGLTRVRKQFGFRNDAGTVRVQSRCRDCRNAHQRKRRVYLNNLRDVYHANYPKDATWDSSGESFLLEKLKLTKENAQQLYMPT